MAEIATFWRGSRRNARRAAGVGSTGAWLVTGLFVLVLLLAQFTQQEPPGIHSALPFLTGALVALLLSTSATPPSIRAGGVVLLALPLAVTLLRDPAAYGSQGVLVLTYSYGQGAATGWLAANAERWLPVLGPLGERRNLLAFAIRWQFLTAGVMLLRFVQLLAWQRAFLPVDILQAELGALMVIAAVHFAAIARNEGHTTRQLTPGIGLGFALAVAVAGAGFPGTRALVSPIFLESWAVVVLVGLVLMASIAGISRTAPLVSMILAALLTHAVLAAEAPGAPWPRDAYTLAALLMLFALVSLSARLLDGRAQDARTSSQTGAFQERSGSWLARMDFDARLVHFPLSSKGSRVTATFGEFFNLSETAPLMEFLSHVEAEMKARGRMTREHAVTLTVTLPGSGPQTVSATLLSATSDSAWLALRSLNDSTALRNRLEELEARAAKAMVREERLLSIASHELRTPVTIMTMLVEEMKAGSDWKEVEAGFETSLTRLRAILDDLRASGPASAERDVFTLREMSAQLLEVFLGAANAQGITIRTEMASQADLPMTGDPARVMITLSKVLHNAIIHSGGREVVISAIASIPDAASGTVSWIIADDGTGIPEERRLTLFEPFTSDGSEGLGSDARTGLGLYTARKAMRLIGGDIRLGDKSQKGCEFIITHPIRVVPQPPQDDKENDMADKDGAVKQPGQFAMLVEDNRLVGELTANRLRKIFGRVTWLEDANTAMSAITAEAPDILFVDHLLPGMTGSELIRRIRQDHGSLPIVGVTASTMGSECEALEAAGADIAVEKPLSYAQIEMLVDDLLVKPAAR